MAGYSGTPLLKKLGIRNGHRFLVLDGSDILLPLLPDLPDTVELYRSLRGTRQFDVVVAFVRTSSALRARVNATPPRLVPNGCLWIAWPKKASGVQTDVSESVVRAVAINAGLVDVKVCAIDETWSGLKLVIPVAAR